MCRLLLSAGVPLATCVHSCTLHPARRCCCTAASASVGCCENCPSLNDTVGRWKQRLACSAATAAGCCFVSNSCQQNYWRPTERRWSGSTCANSISARHKSKCGGRLRPYGRRCLLLTSSYYSLLPTTHHSIPQAYARKLLVGGSTNNTSSSHSTHTSRIAITQQPTLFSLLF